jgi:choline dehydrogenase
MKKFDPNTRPSAGVSRRQFTRSLLAASLAAAVKPFSPAWGASDSSILFDYIIVGSGAGGGPLAARLAREGFKVALLEAGLDALGPEANAIDPSTGIIYQVPAFAGIASETDLLSWAFFVKHYGDSAQQALDSKFVPGKGIYYPRGSTLGGSTAHDAMVWVYPHDDDWEDIAETTGDPSWRPERMREIFERIERCDYCQQTRGHGFNGYMPASVFDSRIFDRYPVLRDMAESGAGAKFPFPDINNPLVAKGAFGAFTAPMHVGLEPAEGFPFPVVTQRRISIREHLVATQQAHPDKLFLITGALASKILMDGKRVFGVEFLQAPPPRNLLDAPKLYEADQHFDSSFVPNTHRIYARREVILSAGVFNTPQLLKLSGIGPASELTALGINVVADLPGVGRNLQDRYEITVNVQLKPEDAIGLYTQCMPTPSLQSDTCFQAWLTGQGLPLISSPFYGPYANNANYAFRIAKSRPDLRLPDLFIAGQATQFDGFFPGYSQMTLGQTWTWLILKVHTKNTAGVVTLRSTDPRRMPEINFHYFKEGNNDTDPDDLNAAVEGVKLARSYVNDPQAAQHVAAELHPGSGVQTDDEIRSYIRNEAWGHHASCTAKIGADHDPMAVLDSSFRVRGVKRLRVVDAGALPHIPGFFPVASIIMLGEKAGDVIVEHAHRAHWEDD